MRARFVFPTLAIFAACREPAAVVDAPIEVVGDVWAGRQVTLRSQAFADPTTLPQVFLGDTKLNIVATDTFLVRAQLPLGGKDAATITLTVRDAEGRAIGLVTARMHGWLQHFHGAPLAGIPAFEPGSPLIGNGLHGLVRLDPLTGASSMLLPDSLHDPTCSRSVSVSVVPDLIAGARRVPGGACRVHAWRFSGGTPVASDSMPFTLSTGFNNGFLVAFMGGGRWQMNVGSRNYVVLGSTVTVTDSLSAPEDFVLSPVGSLLVPEGGTHRVGTPVFSAASGAVAYTLTGIFVTSAAFSPDGDTLWATAVVNVGGQNATRLLEIDAVTGQVGRFRNITPIADGRLAVEAGRPWIFVTGRALGGGLTVSVIDRRDMALAAQLTAGGIFEWPDDPNAFFPVVDVARRRLNIVTVFEESAGSRARPTRIDVLELPQ